MSLAGDLAKTGRIVISFLHDLSQAARRADTVIVLNGGRLCSQGAPAETITSRMLANVYAARAVVDTSGHPAINVHSTLG